MKEHKNPKVLSEGILWMVSAVEDFGVLHLKLKVFSSILSFLSCSLLCLIWFLVRIVLFKVRVTLILQDLVDFCKETGLQSSAAATRNATIKLLGVVHKFVGPGD